MFTTGTDQKQRLDRVAIESKRDERAGDAIHAVGARFPLRLLHPAAWRLRAPHRIATAARYRGRQEAI